MENQIYRIETADSGKIEFYVCGTNELNPYREIREIGVVFLDGGVQKDGCLDIDELDSLMDYLESCRQYIKKFNENSKPKEQNFFRCCGKDPKRNTVCETQCEACKSYLTPNK